MTMYFNSKASILFPEGSSDTNQVQAADEAFLICQLDFEYSFPGKTDMLQHISDVALMWYSGVAMNPKDHMDQWTEERW